MQTKTAKELGFVPQYKPMTIEEMEQFIRVNMFPSEKLPEGMDIHKLFPVQIILKRIEAMELPVSFTEKALLLAVIMTGGNPGAMMTVLIDGLTMFEDQEIDSDMIAMKMYPWGFYTQESIIQYIETYVKTRKVKWSNIY